MSYRRVHDDSPGEYRMTSIWLKALQAILVALVGSLNYDRVKELVFRC